eukprot:7377120-Prymnesium_polylepis.3
MMIGTRRIEQPMTVERVVTSPQSWQRASSLSKYWVNFSPSHSSHRGPMWPSAQYPLPSWPGRMPPRQGVQPPIDLHDHVSSVRFECRQIPGNAAGSWRRRKKPIKALLAIGARVAPLNTCGGTDTRGTERCSSKPRLPPNRPCPARLGCGRAFAAPETERAHSRLTCICEALLLAERPSWQSLRHRFGSAAKVA